MVQDDDLVGAVGRFAQPLLGARQLHRPKPARLMAPRAYRVEPDDVECRGGVRRLRRLPLPFELMERSGEARGERIRDVVITWYREHRRSELTQETRSAGKLILTSAMAQVAARDHELGLEPLDQYRCTALDC